MVPLFSHVAEIEVNGLGLVREDGADIVDAAAAFLLEAFKYVFFWQPNLFEPRPGGQALEGGMGTPRSTIAVYQSHGVAERLPLS
jgi:hypothetical protein